MCGQIRLTLVEVRQRTPSADLHGTSEGRGDVPSSVGPTLELLLPLLLLLPHPQKDVLELWPRSFDVFLQVGFVVENPKPKQQVEQGLNMDRINDWFWNPV